MLSDHHHLMKRAKTYPNSQPAQSQGSQPGKEHQMEPAPVYVPPQYQPAGKLVDRVAIVTGGDSGIGRSASVLFALEGADVVIVYLNENKDAELTRSEIEAAGRRCLLLPGDIGDSQFANEVVAKTIAAFGRLDIVVNNAAEQHPQTSLSDITDEQLEKIFRTNIFSYFYLTRAALPHLKPGASIINTTSVTAYRGSHHLLDYSATKGAIVAFTRSLSQSLAEIQIRVNGVAPGPIWTPLIPASFPPDKVAKFGQDVPLGRAGQPAEVGPSFVFLASEDSSYMTGQVLHPNGGEIINT